MITEVINQHENEPISTERLVHIVNQCNNAKEVSKGIAVLQDEYAFQLGAETYGSNTGYVVEVY